MDGQRAIFHPLDEPVPTLADPFPADDPLPGAYELHLPSDNVTIWYTMSSYEAKSSLASSTCAPIPDQHRNRRAGDGNRTRIASLEGFGYSGAEQR